MVIHRITPLLFGIAVLCAGARAQLMWTHENAKHDFKIKVPKFMKEQPLEPHEEQILAKFQGVTASTDSFVKGECELIYLVVRIARVKGAVTGDTEDFEDLRAKSRKEFTKEFLNKATTVPGFLARRGFKSEFTSRLTLTKPIKNKNGDTYKVEEIRDTAFNEARYQDRDYVIIRSFTIESDSEIFGLITLGLGSSVFLEECVESAQSLQRKSIDAVVTRADPYEGSALRDIEGRRKVRSRLVKNWEGYDTENFLLITNSKNKKMIEDMLLDLEIMRSEYTKHFPPVGEMTAVSTVRICAGYDDYLGYGAPDGTGGYWNFVDEELVLFEPGKVVPKARPWLKKVDPIAVLYHEAMHQYLHYANSQVAPTSWFNEGYGEYFGGARVDRKKKEVDRIDKNKFRMEWIKVAQKEGKDGKGMWPDLRNVVRMSQGEFYSGSALQNYAFAWAFCYFLELERQKTSGRNEEWAEIPTNYLKHLRDATQRQLAKIPKGAPKDEISKYTEKLQEEAFEKTFAKIDTDKLEEAWKQFMRKL